MKDFAGIVVVDKDKGFTSHDVVAKVRKHFGIKKVGHAGTLDPNATGVLVILMGRATKLSGNFLSQEKEYIATMKLGEKTDSGDCDGEVIEKKEVKVTPEDIENIMNDFEGEIDQVPPMYSAKKIKGKKLYKLARKGIEVERKAKKVVIKELRLIKTELPLVEFNVICEKGTYIRQLAEDMGDKLGCGAHLTELRRTRSGDFKLEDSIKLEHLLKMDGIQLKGCVEKFSGLSV